MEAIAVRLEALLCCFASLSSVSGYASKAARFYKRRLDAEVSGQTFQEDPPEEAEARRPRRAGRGSVFAPSSFLLLVVRPGAPSSVFAPSSDALCS